MINLFALKSATTNYDMQWIVKTKCYTPIKNIFVIILRENKWTEILKKQKLQRESVKETFSCGVFRVPKWNFIQSSNKACFFKQFFKVTVVEFSSFSLTSSQVCWVANHPVAFVSKNVKNLTREQILQYMPATLDGHGKCCCGVQQQKQETGSKWGDHNL